MVELQHLFPLISYDHTLMGLISASLDFAISRIFAIFAKLKTREIFNIAFCVEKPVKTLHLCPKLPFSAVFRLFREIQST